MGDGRSDSGRDWSFRRKLSSSSSTTTGKSTKESSRSRSNKSTSTPAAADAAASPPTPSRSVSSNNRTTPTSPNGKIASSKSKTNADEPGESTPTTPIFGTVPGGFRTNIFRASARERSAPIQEEEQSSTVEKRKTGSRGSSPLDVRFTGGRGKGPGEFTNPQLSRTTSASMSDVPSPEPNDLTREADVEVEEEVRGSGKRGSVIEKVTQRAKLVLPSKRTKGLGKSESSRSLAGKSTGSSSSMHSSTKIPTGHQEPSSSSSEEDEEEKEEETERGGQAEGRAVSSKKAMTRSQGMESRDKQLPPVAASADDDQAPSPTSSTNRKGSLSTPDGDIAPPNIVRSKTVPPRITSDRDHGKAHSHTRSAHSNSSSRNLGTGNRIMEMHPPEPRIQDTPEVESTQRSLPLRSPRSINSLNAARQKKPSMNSIREVSLASAHVSAMHPSIGTDASISSPRVSNHASAGQTTNRPSALRSTSAIKMSTIATTSASSSATVTRTTYSSSHPTRHSGRALAGKKAPAYSPPMPDTLLTPKMDPAPPTGIYWSRAACFGYDHAALRAHTTTLIGSNIYVFGGCDSKTCFNSLYVFDADCLFWSTPDCTGDIPPPLRAMTATAVGKKIVIFGGGDGGTYTNDIYVLDTLNFRYTKVVVEGPQPCRRRAHTACLYRNGIYVFGGGDGERALNDVWRLDVSDVSKLSWKLISPPSVKVHPSRPTARGYHTANMVGSKMIVFGGSDGVECFRDVWVFDVEGSGPGSSPGWKVVAVQPSFPRLSHTATVVGSYLFVIGGHDGVEYSADVLLLNLVTMQWDRRKTYGVAPSGRGYHGTVLHDSRLFVVGGFDGHTVFDDTFILELAVCAYYSQISHFTIDV